MQLPNGARAIVDIEKLTEYCLNPEHPRGRHKARVFESSLGITMRDAEWLRMQLLAAARDKPAQRGHQDRYGQRYTIDFEVVNDRGQAIMRSHWIVRSGETSARLTTCFIL